jgi:NAD+ synthase
MIVLYDQSMAFDGLVVGTSNKTETLLGYTTLFGDNAAAILPIGDLYKAQVRQLSRALGVPDVIVDKAPSADLWPGQTDEGELGYTYDDADQLLYLLVNLRYTLDEAVEAGFPRDLVDRVWRTVQRMHYKRRPPAIAKLSTRTIGIDFLYMRDWNT